MASLLLRLNFERLTISRARSCESSRSDMSMPASTFIRMHEHTFITATVQLEPRCQQLMLIGILRRTWLSLTISHRADQPLKIAGATAAGSAPPDGL